MGLLTRLLMTEDSYHEVALYGLINKISDDRRQLPWGGIILRSY